MRFRSIDPASLFSCNHCGFLAENGLEFTQHSWVCGVSEAPYPWGSCGRPSED